MTGADIFNELFVLELANNHLGKLDRGLKIISTYAQVVTSCRHRRFRRPGIAVWIVHGDRVLGRRAHTRHEHFAVNYTGATTGSKRRAAASGPRIGRRIINVRGSYPSR